MVDDKALLKLLEAGIETDVAAKQLNLPVEVIKGQVKQYIESGILRCAGDREEVDWKAYGRWLQRRNQKDAAEGLLALSDASV